MINQPNAENFDVILRCKYCKEEIISGARNPEGHKCIEIMIYSNDSLFVFTNNKEEDLDKRLLVMDKGIFYTCKISTANFGKKLLFDFSCIQQENYIQFLGNRENKRPFKFENLSKAFQKAIELLKETTTISYKPFQGTKRIKIDIEPRVIGEAVGE